ncbi:MAG: hypothetical protein KC983_01735 [Phycisphaerales bacterium]|nr:hypothetical protein [Phycisphaerales bacterium]
MPHATIIPILLAGLGLSVTTAAATAQQVDATHAVDPTEPTYLHPIEAGIGDVGPGSTSLRIIETGLDMPSGFAKVYRSPIAGHFMRVDGALHAVFPRSRYTPTQQGDVPTVPDGTVFYIGMPVGPFEAGGQPAVHAADGTAPAARLNMRVDAQPAPRHMIHIDDVPPAPGHAAEHSHEHHAPTHVLPSHELLIPAPTTPVDITALASVTIVTDEAYRRVRIHELLHRAARADHDADWNAVMGEPAVR